MVFGLSSNKRSPTKSPHNTQSVTPPPPYFQDSIDPAIYATETTTTTTTHVVTTTTHTTTHFFSLPLWRRRGTPAYSPAAARSTDELGVINSHSAHVSTSPTMHARNKDLPPTPDLSPDNLTPPTGLSPDASSLHDGSDTLHIATKVMGSRSGAPSAASSRASSLQPVSRCSYAPSDSPCTSQPTVVLARAALGLGLPHAAPASVAASSSSPEVNTIAFSSSQASSASDARRSNHVVRQAKSFYKEPDAIHDDPSLSTIRERRRTRGFSLGPLSLISSDAKGKQRETETNAGPPQPKSLTRKGSFWSRKRVNSRPDPALAPPSPSPRPTLPLFPPISPFNINTPVPSPGLTVTSQPSELQRRHSERTRKQSTRHDDERPRPEAPPRLSSNIAQSSRRRRAQRPQTADSATSPRLSFFSEPRPFVSSPISSPLPTPLERPAASSPAHPETRHRAQTNPPLLHRLSINLFGSLSSNTHTPTSTSSPNILDGQAATSPPSSLASSRPSLSKPSIEVPKPRSDGESPEVYLQRLVEAISKAEIASVLASSADAFHARALRAYIESFNFVEDPLDVALRKLLMDVGLPRETQQIDRVIEAFAARYVQCNPNLFISDDHPYILAFSLIMLHTDAFNKSNKRKMTKPDYIKNTRLPGVAPEVLDCFYDNIVFVPFIFIEDPVDVNGQRGLVPEAISRRMSTINAPSPGGLNGSGPTLLGKSNKIDPYYLITQNRLDELRVNTHAHIPMESPYSYQGTSERWDEDELQRAFASATVIEVAGLENRYLASPWFSLSVTSGPGPMFQSSLGSLPPLPPTNSGVWAVKVTKVGLLLRKEDMNEGGRRAMSRKWREWCVLLTGSQLLFFRDASWAGNLQAHGDQTHGHLLPQAYLPQPDEILSVRDTIAVYDKTYLKYPNTWRLVLPDGRQYLLQAHDETEMNEWIVHINYASAFKTAGVRMRPLGLSSKDIDLTGIAAAVSHLKDVERHNSKTHSPVIRTWNGRRSEDLNLLSRGAAESEPMSPDNLASPPVEGLRTRHGSVGSAGSNPSTPPYENSSRLFKATFDEVKTELATGRWRSLDEMSIRSTRKRAFSLESMLEAPSFAAAGHASDGAKLPFSSRPEIIRSKVEDLNSKISAAKTQLDTDMRFARNLAILTPFQRATRDRVHAAVQNVAKRVMQVRLDIEKLVCHRDVLIADLAAEERDWQRTKKLAMRAATQKLVVQREAEREAARTVKRMEREYEHDRSRDYERGQGSQRLPRLSLSAYVDQTATPETSSPVTIPRSANTSHHSRAPESSAAESFHSALSGSFGWHGRRRSATVTFGSPETFDSSLTSPAEGASSAASDGLSPLSGSSPERRRAVPLAAQTSLDSTSSSVGEGGGHEKFYTAPEMPEEQAEEWHKTRAAKRVSLVKLPSDLRISVLFGKHVRDQTSTQEVAEDPSTTPTSAASPASRRRSLSPYQQDPGATVAMLDM